MKLQKIPNTYVEKQDCLSCLSPKKSLPLHLNMKKFKNIFAIFFAAYFLLAGNGVNFIDYCCNQCKDRGMEVLIAGCHETEILSCCFAHSSHNKTESCSEPTTHSAHKCQLKRYTLDDGLESSLKIPLPIIMKAIVLPHFLTGIAYSSTTLNKNFLSIGYVYDSGRNLLNHICVLTI